MHLHLVLGARDPRILGLPGHLVESVYRKLQFQCLAQKIKGWTLEEDTDCWPLTSFTHAPWAPACVHMHILHIDFMLSVFGRYCSSFSKYNLLYDGEAIHCFKSVLLNYLFPTILYMLFLSCLHKETVNWYSVKIQIHFCWVEVICKSWQTLEIL